MPLDNGGMSVQAGYPVSRRESRLTVRRRRITSPVCARRRSLGNAAWARLGLTVPLTLLTAGCGFGGLLVFPRAFATGDDGFVQLALVDLDDSQIGRRDDEFLESVSGFSVDPLPVQKRTRPETRGEEDGCCGRDHQEMEPEKAVVPALCVQFVKHGASGVVEGQLGGWGHSWLASDLPSRSGLRHQPADPKHLGLPVETPTAKARIGKFSTTNSEPLWTEDPLVLKPAETILKGSVLVFKDRMPSVIGSVGSRRRRHRIGRCQGVPVPGLLAAEAPGQALHVVHPTGDDLGGAVAVYGGCLRLGVTHLLHH